jgi:molybdate transport system substrate-binding protein
MSQSVQKIAQIYTKKFHQDVHIIQGSSGELLEEIIHSQDGDLYLPGTPRYILKHSDASLFPYHRIIGKMQLVYFTRFGNPLEIDHKEDLLRPTLRLGIGASELGSIGKITQKVIEEKWGKEFYQKMSFNALYFAVDSRDMNSLFTRGKIDAGITWKPALSALLQQKKATIVTFHNAINTTRNIMISTLRYSTQQSEAKRFIDLILSDIGQSILADKGFEVD